MSADARKLAEFKLPFKVADDPGWRCVVDSTNRALTEHEIVELLNGTRYVPLLAGGECSTCGFRYFEYKGHIIPCPRCEAERLDSLINTPELEDFDKGVPLESAHQAERWGEAHDRSKSAENWYWLIGYLSGKALRSAIAGDREKALHHTISAAAALRNWHRAIQSDTTGAGIGHDPDLVALDGGESAEAD